MEPEIRQEQKQILSRRMILSSTILQMTSAELESYLAEQSLENPIIDLVEKEAEPAAPKMPPAAEGWYRRNDEQNRCLYRKTESAADEPDRWNFSAEEPKSLADDLWEQLLVKHVPEEYEKDLKIILESLDDNGYFSENEEEFAHAFNMDKKRLSMLLELIRTLEPAGVGARSLSECLCIQLKRQGILSEPLKQLIENHLKLLAQNRLPEIAKALGVTLNDVKEYKNIIRSLNPRPASYYAGSASFAYVNPDIIVNITDGKPEAALNEQLYPEIVLNEGYMNMYRENDDKELAGYLKEKIDAAVWIRRCIEQRNKTLLAVAKEITLRQEDFFTHASGALKPLRLLDVAKALNVNESTVSRAINQKYLQCSKGTFPLNYFFAKNALRSTSAQNTSANDAAGAEKEPAENDSATVSDIKSALKKIIAEEDKKKPLSDRAVSEKLAAMNLAVSRRTVAKYRDEENIPPASGRKKI